MAAFREYVFARSLEEAYALNQKKSAVIVGGNMWLRMCGMKRRTAIDLTGLGLDRIEEEEEGFRVGAMVTLRALETDGRLNAAFGGVFAPALSPIVGTQFRNGATAGGSVYSRFGFSDVSALLMALRARVVLFRRGEVALEEYQFEAWDRDVITHIVIPKGQRAGISSVRLSATDFPVLVCAASRDKSGLRLVVGGRPARAMVVSRDLNPASVTLREMERLVQEVPMGSNLRASQAYRRKIAPVLLMRAAAACMED